MATPIWALAAATRRSAAAMSGLRSRSSDGRPTGTAGGTGLNGAAAREKVEGGFPMRSRYGVLQLRPLHAQVDQLGLGGLQLGLGLEDIGLSRHTAAIAVLGQLQRLLVGRDRRLEKLPLGVNRSQLKIGLGQGTLSAQAGGFEVGGAGLGAVPAGLDRAADAPPDVGLPGQVDG